MSFALSSESPYAESKRRMAHSSVKHGANIILLGGYKESIFPPFFWTQLEYHDRMQLYIYNTTSTSWQLVETSGCSTDPKISGGCAALVDDALFVLCGYSEVNGRTNSVYKLDLLTMEWVYIDPHPNSQLPSKRDKFCVWVNDQRIFVFGGFGPPAAMKAKFVEMDGYEGWNNSVHIFDTDTNQWHELVTKGHRPCPRAAHAGTTYKTKGYLFGGRFQDTRMNDLHYLDLETGTWSGCIETIGVQPEGRSWHSLSTASDSFLFLYGGVNTNNIILGDAWIFNVPTSEWILVTTEPPYPCVSTRHSLLLC
jgi:N-acetylneuraminic acid mutarotase